MKFPHPAHLSPVPQAIDPDRWLLALPGKTYKRRLDRNGCFPLGNQTYYVQKKLHGHYAIVWVNGQRRELAIIADRQLSLNRLVLFSYTTARKLPICASALSLILPRRGYFYLSLDPF